MGAPWSFDELAGRDPRSERERMLFASMASSSQSERLTRYCRRRRMNPAQHEGKTDPITRGKAGWSFHREQDWNTNGDFVRSFRVPVYITSFLSRRS